MTTPQKILIVDDDIMIITLYKELLTAKGYIIETAHDGKDGWEKALAFSPSLIMLDIIMPGVNGIQLLEQLKGTPNTAEIPVIMLTNVNDIRSAQTALRLGAIKYLIKSDFDPDKTVQAINEVLGLYAKP